MSVAGNLMRELRLKIRGFQIWFAHKLSEACKWSNLGSVGRSNLGKLTILMPFIGYLIIFNPSFVDFFQSSLPNAENPSPEIVLWLHERRLSFLYFGLLFLGISTLLYVLLAPEQLRKFSSAADYISEMQKVTSPALIVTSFEDIVDRFMASNSAEQRHPMFAEQSLSFPSGPSGLLHDLVRRMFHQADTEIFHDVEADHESPYSITTGTGDLLTDKIIEVMYSGRRVDRSFLESMRFESTNNSNEIFFLQHYALDYQLFGFRLLVAFLMVIGFLLLLVPTISTSFLVALASV